MPVEQADSCRALIEQTPTTATVKGMFFEMLLKSADRAGVPRPTDEKFLGFRSYPLRRLMTMMVDLAPQLHPTSTTEDALRRFGRDVYPTLTSSTVGSVLFSLAGQNWQQALQLSPKAYALTLSPAEARVDSLESTHATIALRSVWNFPESFQVGVMEGAMECYSIAGEVRAVRQGRPCDVDLILDWS